MNIPLIVLLVGAALLNVAGNSLIKFSSIYNKMATASNTIYYLWILGAMTSYGVSFLLFASALSRSKLSVVQPVFSGISFLAATLVALILLKEPISLMQYVGIGVILVGIILVVR